MITDKQREYLQDLINGEVKQRDDPHKHAVYFNRIRKRISRELENGVWLAHYYPDILRDEFWEIEELGEIKRVRLKMLLQMIKGMYPDVDPALVRYSS